MKRKIALLLTFTMIFSLLPMTVSATSFWNVPPGSTGRLFTQAGFHDHIRHMQNGTVVATLDSWTAFNSDNDFPNNYVFVHSESAAVYFCVCGLLFSQ